MQTRDQAFLGTEPVGRLLMRLAIPTVIAQLVNMLYNIVDRIYIGHIAGIGSLALTGVGVCMPIIMIVTAFAALVASGVAVVAHLLGYPVFGSVAATLVGSGLVLLARHRGLVLPAADDALNLGRAVRRAIAKSRRWLPRRGEPGNGRG